MTTAGANALWAPAGVYPPQEDTQLLIDVMTASGLAAGRRVADLCTGTGAVAAAAAAAGASRVTALDICPRAVQCARANTSAAGVSVHLGSWARAIEFGPYDLVVSNPPYVPGSGGEGVAGVAAPARSYHAGSDGRLVLDPLCEAASGLLEDGGTMLVVQSEFSGVGQTLKQLRSSGLRTSVVARQSIPFGPVLSARAAWLERVGLLDAGRRVEQLVVIRADKP